jgi:hypothetical protein
MSITPIVPISFSDLQTEFGGENPISLGEYYKNAATGYTTNVVGVPIEGTPISLGLFFGLKQYVPPFPIAVQTTYVNAPWPFGGAVYEWITGASGINTTRTGGTTFNNIGTYVRYRSGFINNQSLILQAKAGDTLQFQLNNGATNDSDYEINSLWLNLGSGWFLVQSVGANGSHTDTINYTLSTSLVPGNYGIFVYNNYGTAGASSYASANFYSLHIA